MATISELVDEVSNHLDITISDGDAIWAYNEFAILVTRILQARYGDGRKSTTTQIDSSGVNLDTLITDARNFNVGFEVWLGTDATDLDTDGYLERIHPGIAQRAGFFILNGSGTNMLYLKNVGSTGKLSTAKDIVIFYKNKRTALASTDDLSTYNFEFDQDLEFAFKRYLQSIFFDGNFRPENATNALIQARNWIEVYANEPQTT